VAFICNRLKGEASGSNSGTDQVGRGEVSAGKTFCEQEKRNQSNKNAKTRWCNVKRQGENGGSSGIYKRVEGKGKKIGDDCQVGRAGWGITWLLNGARTKRKKKRRWGKRGLLRKGRGKKMEPRNASGGRSEPHRLPDRRVQEEGRKKACVPREQKP